MFVFVTRRDFKGGDKAAPVSEQDGPRPQKIKITHLKACSALLFFPFSLAPSVRPPQRGSLLAGSGVLGMLVGCPAGDEWTWQSAAGYQSGLVSVSAGATLYVFLCIFFRERRRSGRGRRCKKRPLVSRPSLFWLLFIPVLHLESCELHHLSVDNTSSSSVCRSIIISYIINILQS